MAELNDHERFGLKLQELRDKGTPYQETTSYRPMTQKQRDMADKFVLAIAKSKEKENKEKPKEEPKEQPKEKEKVKEEEKSNVKEFKDVYKAKPTNVGIVQSISFGAIGKDIINGDYTSFMATAGKGLIKAGLAIATAGTSLAATTVATSAKMKLLQEALNNLDTTTPTPTPQPAPQPAPAPRPAPTPFTEW